MQIAALSFSTANMLAVGVSQRVDFYSLNQPESQDDIEFDKLAPLSQLFKFEDAVSALKFRQDG